MFSAPVDSHAARVKTTKSQARRGKKTTTRGRRAPSEPANRVKRKTAPKVTFQGGYKADRISNASIVKAVHEGVTEFLQTMKARSGQTQGESNSMNASSVVVKSVAVLPASKGPWTMRKGERAITARVQVNVKGTPVQLEVKSVMILNKRLPGDYDTRVKPDRTMKVRDLRYAATEGNSVVF